MAVATTATLKEVGETLAFIIERRMTTKDHLKKFCNQEGRTRKQSSVTCAENR